MRMNYNNFVTIFYIKIKNGRKIIILTLELNFVF